MLIASTSSLLRVQTPSSPIYKDKQLVPHVSHSLISELDDEVLPMTLYTASVCCSPGDLSHQEGLLLQDHPLPRHSPGAQGLLRGLYLGDQLSPHVSDSHPGSSCTCKAVSALSKIYTACYFILGLCLCSLVV